VASNIACSAHSVALSSLCTPTMPVSEFSALKGSQTYG
jgi:hypothetical protein